MSQPTLVECWNFEPPLYGELMKFRDDLNSRYPTANITNVNGQDLIQQKYSDMDKLVLLFTRQPVLNEAATKAFSRHDKSRTRVICYPNLISTNGIPAVVATNRQELVKEMVKVMGNSVTYQSATPSALGSLSKLPLDQRQQAKPLGLYVFRSKNKEFNHRMNEIFYNFKESPMVEFNEIRGLLLMQDRPNKLQLLVVSSSDIDSIYQDLETLRQSDSHRLTVILFNTSTEIEDNRGQCDLIANDKSVVENQLRRMIERLQAAGNKQSIMLAPIQESNSSLTSSRAIINHGALQPQSIMSRSLSPGLRSSNRISNRPTSIITNNAADPQVYVMDFHDSGYKQFYTMLPVNYNVVRQIPILPAASNQKHYLIAPAERSAEVLSRLPDNMKVIFYGNTPHHHPSVQLVTHNFDEMRNHLINNEVRINNRPIHSAERSIVFGNPSIMTGNSPTQVINSVISAPRLNIGPPLTTRRDLSGFQNASVQPIRTSYVGAVNRPPYFGIPSTNQLPYFNQSNVSVGASNNSSGQLARLHSADPRNFNSSDYLNPINRPRSVIPGRIGANDVPIVPNPSPVNPTPNVNPTPAVNPTPTINPLPAPTVNIQTNNGPDPRFNSNTNNTTTTIVGGTTKTITTEVKPGNRVVEQIVTTTTIEPRVLQIPIITKIINETIQQAPKPPSPCRHDHQTHHSRVIIKEIPYPVVERRTIDVNTDYPTTTEYITQTSTVIPAVTTTVKTKETETINQHTHLEIDSSLGRKIGRTSRVVEIKVPQLSIPEEIVELETSMRRSRANRVVRQQIRVHPPDASAAIVQEIREVLPSIDMLSPSGRSRALMGGRLQESTMNILNNSHAAGSSRVHYRLETNNSPVTTYVKEYVETNVEPSTLVDHVIDHRVRVGDTANSISSVKITETGPSRVHETRDHRVSHHRVVEGQPIFDHVRVVQPTVREYTRTLDTSTRYADSKNLSPHIDLKDYERRIENGIEVFTKRVDRSLSNGKTVERTYSTNDYSPRQYISPNIKSTESTTPLKIDSQATINRHVKNGLQLEEITQMIDKRYHGDPIEITSRSPIEHTYTTTTHNHNDHRTSNHHHYDRHNSSGSIYYTTSTGQKEYVVVPQSGKVRELSEGQRRIRKRSGSLRGSRVESGRQGVLYLVPDSRKYLTDELYKFVSKKDKVQPYYLNEDLRFVRYNEYGTIFVFPIDEAQTHLPAVLEQPNAFIVKMSRPAESPKELRVTRLHDLVGISKETKLRSKPVSRQDCQLVFKKLNDTIDQVSERFLHFDTHRFFSSNELDHIITQLDPQKIVVLVVDQVPENIERFRNFSLFSCVVIPKGHHYKAQKARYPKLKWIHEDDIDLICDDIRQEIKRLSNKQGLQKTYSSLKSSAPRLISYYEDSEVQDHALSRLQNRMILSQYHDHSSLTKRIFEAAGNKKVIVLNPQFALYASEIDSMSKGEALIMIYDKQSRVAREHMGNPKVRVARNINELIEELEIYLQYGN